jgi:hypothetical protein
MLLQRAWRITVSIILACSLAAPGWAWRGGWRGPRVGVYLGPWPWWNDPYYDSYYPYDPPYAYYPADEVPYVLEGVAPPQQTGNLPDNARHDLRFLKKQIDMARDQVDFALEDGDVSRAQHDAEMRHLEEIEAEAHAEAKAGGGTITGDQERDLLRQIRGGERAEAASPPPQNQSLNLHLEDNLRMVNDRMTRLHSLLDNKQATGDITKVQHDGMSGYLARIEKQARSDAEANGGSLARDQESAILEQLQRAEDAIARNFIVN